MRGWIVVVAASALGCHGPAPSAARAPTPASATAPAASSIATVAPSPSPAPPPVPAPPVPAPPPPPVPAPPLPRLATPGTLFLIDTDGGAARCQRWTVVPGEDGAGQLVRPILIDGDAGTDAIDYVSAGSTLTLTGRSRTIPDTTSSSTSCDVPLPAAALPDAIAVGDSRWFVDAAGCADALTRRARVATDLTACDLGPSVSARTQRATKRAFERLLRRGGVAYTDEGDRCEAVHVTPARRQPRGQVTGAMWHRVVADGVPGRWGYNYDLSPAQDRLALLGPGATYADGSGYGLGCGDWYHLEYGRGAVTVSGTLYLTRAGCRAALASRRLHDAWVPVVAEDDGLDGEDAADGGAADAPDADEALTDAGFTLGGC